MYVTKTIAGENQWTKAIPLIGFFNYSGQGTFSATITLQRSFDKGENWEDVESKTTAFSLVGFEPLPPFIYSKPTTYYRLGVKTGGFTSGSILVRLGIR